MHILDAVRSGIDHRQISSILVVGSYVIVWSGVRPRARPAMGNSRRLIDWNLERQASGKPMRLCSPQAADPLLNVNEQHFWPELKNIGWHWFTDVR